MDTASLAMVAMCCFAVLTAFAALFTKDTFYSALYMSATLVTIAGMFALNNVQPVFVLITFIFVGAIGAVTVALAAMYRDPKPKIQIDFIWFLPAIITFAAIFNAIFGLKNVPSAFSGSEVSAFVENYAVFALFFFALAILLMLAVVKFVRREEV